MFRLPHIRLFIHFTHNKTVPNQHVVIIETARQGGEFANTGESSYSAIVSIGNRAAMRDTRGAIFKKNPGRRETGPSSCRYKRVERFQTAVPPVL